MNLDQTILNWAFGLVGTLGGFVVTAMWNAIGDLRKDNAALAKSIGDLSDKINRDFVRRDDYRDDITEIKSGILRIFEKLDGKADRP